MMISLNSTVQFSVDYTGRRTSYNWQYSASGMSFTVTSPIISDWIQAARALRSLSQTSTDSTPILRALREERSQK